MWDETWWSGNIQGWSPWFDLLQDIALCAESEDYPTNRHCSSSPPRQVVSTTNMCIISLPFRISSPPTTLQFLQSVDVNLIWKAICIWNNISLNDRLGGGDRLVGVKWGNLEIKALFGSLIIISPSPVVVVVPFLLRLFHKPLRIPILSHLNAFNLTFSDNRSAKRKYLEAKDSILVLATQSANYWNSSLNPISLALVLIFFQLEEQTNVCEVIQGSGITIEKPKSD